MRIIALSSLRLFWQKHPDAELPLRSWYTLASRATWQNPADVKRAYSSASFVANNRIVFNTKGNDYRLVLLVRYDKNLMYVRFVGTHSQYERIDASLV